MVGILFSVPAISNGSESDTPITLITEATYQAGGKDSFVKSQGLAMFEARKKAVVLAAKDYMQKGLLKNYGDQEAEIFCLTANKIQVRVIKESYAENARRFTVKLKAEVFVSDFMEAEIENQVLEKEESDFPWKEEMEQHVAPSIDPGRELSRAYRYLRKGQARIAIIYLDHLVKKYPFWGEVYYLRALGMQRMHYEDQMKQDLEKACSLDFRAACEALQK
jgi:tetratricopeptide (TPR) repeat protein